MNLQQRLQFEVNVRAGQRTLASMRPQPHCRALPELTGDTLLTQDQDRARVRMRLTLRRRRIAGILPGQHRDPWADDPRIQVEWPDREPF